MNRKIRIGIFIFIFCITFSLMGCSTNNASKEDPPAKENITTNEDTTTSDLDKYTKSIQDIFGENIKYRGKDPVKGSSDEFFLFYADSVEGLDPLTYKLNVRTGTVTDGTSGMPLCNILVASPNLNNLDLDSYKASVEKIVSPLIIDKGYTINGLFDAFLGFIGDGNIEYQVYKNDVPYVIQVEPFMQEVTEFGEVVTDISDSENAEENSNQLGQDEEQTLEGLLDDGFTIIEEQSFWVDMNSWGKVRFVSGYFMNNKTPELHFYIVSSNLVVLATLPDSYPNTHELESVQAISFKDMNGDGEKDIIIIGNYNTWDATNTVASATTEASVYYYSWESFIQLPWYNDLLNDSGNNTSIAAIVKEGDKILQQIQTPNATSKEEENEIDRLASLICNGKLLDAGDLGYADLSASLVVFFNSSTYSEVYITSLVGDYLAEDTVRTVSGDKALKVKSEKFDSLLVDIIGDVISYNYIESGGGTIWSFISSYAVLDAKFAVNKYVKGITLNDQDNLRSSLSSLSTNWSELRDEIQIVIKDKGFKSDDYSVDLTEDELEEMVDLRLRLHNNIKSLTKLAANDEKAKILVDVVNDKLEISMN
ncbi:hypothetical protein J2T12_000266 [Paenibacillus anaericanus]|uniref:hypothetical protein n=1 Tax=Paenibacillus anaericanus TaxID=170367 RepID=UPI0027835907|nr:hypothetical protein [Paenibacillus anaericanus]MDQ0086872.1 hypothetical protein [Paenibacillus anaericanus]